MLITGQVTEKELADVFGEQANALAEAGTDGLVVETMADLVEARIAVEAAVATGLPVVACMSFGSGKQGDRTMMGIAPDQAAAELTSAGAAVIGTNCGIQIQQSVAICEAFAAATDRPIWIKPNAGLPELVDGEVVYRADPEEFASYLPKLVSAGASFIGGCCGTSPKFVEALRRRLAA
jgi:methionine synthase I (cobalamin-dependent)